MRYFDTRIWQLSRCKVRGIHSGRNLPGTPLLFLHGLDGDLDEFHLIWPLLEKERPLLAYDHPGFGPLGREEPLSVEEMADCAAEVIGQQCGGQAVDILGTSMGTMVSLALAHRHPHLVRRVILLAPAGVWDYEKDLQAIAEKVFPLVNHPVFLPLIASFSLISHSTQNTPPGWTDWDWVRWQLWRKSQKEFAVRAAAYLQTIPRLLATDCRPWAEQLKKPLLVVCGDADAPHSIRASHFYHEAVEGSELIWIPGGKHMIWMGFYDRIAALVRNFCQG